MMLIRKSYFMLRGFLLLIFLSVFGFNLQAQEFPFIKEALKECSLSQDDVSEFRITSDYKDRKAGFRVIWIKQLHQGINIHGADLQLVISREGKLFRQQCGFIKDVHSKLQTAKIKSPEEAIGLLLESENINAAIPVLKENGSNKWEAEIPGKIKGELILVKEYYPLKDGTIPLVYTVRFSPGKKQGLWQIRIDAVNGKIIEKRNLEISCAPHSHSAGDSHCAQPRDASEESAAAVDGASYNVFPYPLTSPLDGPRQIITNPSDQEASPFGWHDLEGTRDTRTNGNNVSAYDDQDDDNAPDDYVEGGADLVFNFPFTPVGGLNPFDNREASITNLFYWNNIVHDFLWHYGFDESSGNFQFLNYTGEGGDRDGVNAEAFDGGGTNNANFATPPDGEIPRMQMYLWNGRQSTFLHLNSPVVLEGDYNGVMASFGPNLIEPITADVLVLEDGTAADQGCFTPLNDLTGKIAIMRAGGSCSFAARIANAQEAGAIAAIVVGTSADLYSMYWEASDDVEIYIPSLMITLLNGNQIIQRLNNGTVVNATLNIPDYYDSSFDAGVIAHEYGHGVSNRLTGGPFNTDCLYNNEQMGEGWSDFLCLIFTTTSANNAIEPRAVGNYVEGNNNDGPGIRNFPYSTDMDINPVTYSYIIEHDQVHSVGFVWCGMLWDLYWDMIAEYGYDDDILHGNGGNNMAIKLVMDGMRLQQCSPGFVDGRDAILEADEVNFGGVNRCLIWRTFARRGVGFSANQGSTDSATDGIEAFDVPQTCPLAESADFTFSAEAICAGNSVIFTDVTQPGSASRVWTFQGGNPTISSDSIVVVNYDGPGTYDVGLSITNIDGTDEKHWTGLVNVVEISVSAYLTPPTAETAGDGGVYLIPNGGVAPYTANWENFPDNNDLVLGSLSTGVYTVSITDHTGCTFDTAVVISATGINALADAAVSVYPNPVKEQLSISCQGNSIRSLSISDASGRLVSILPVNGQPENLKVGTNFLSPGIYFLTVKLTSGEQSVKRFVKL